MATAKTTKKGVKKSAEKKPKKLAPSAKKASSKKVAPGAKKAPPKKKAGTAKNTKVIVTKKADGSSSVRQGSGFVGNLPSESQTQAPSTARRLLGRKRKPEVEDFSKSPLTKVLFKVRLTDASISKDVALLHTLALDKNSKIRVAVASNKNTSEKDLDLLNKDSDAEVRATAAGNSNQRFTTLHDLAHNALLENDVPVLIALAGNWRTMDETLDLLSLHPSEDVRANVASHQNTSPNILHKFSTNKSFYIKLAVAGNEYTEKDDLQTLASLSDTNIKLAVAGNKGAYRDTLEMLMLSGNHSVAETARYTLEHYND